MRGLMTIAGLALVLSGALAGCSGGNIDDEDNPGFIPPTATKRAEYAALLETRFVRLDRNVDGSIGKDEINARAADRMAALDADHDGKVTHAEFIDGGLARFDREDLNHDGIVTGAERRRANGNGG